MDYLATAAAHGRFTAELRHSRRHQKQWRFAALSCFLCSLEVILAGAFCILAPLRNSAELFKAFTLVRPARSSFRQHELMRFVEDYTLHYHYFRFSRPHPPVP